MAADAGVAEDPLELELQPEAKAIEAVDARKGIMMKSDLGFEWFMQS